MCDKMTKLTHNAYGYEQSISFSAGSDIHEYIDQIQRLLIAASFHPESVKEGFLCKAEEIIENEKNIHTQ